MLPGITAGLVVHQVVLTGRERADACSSQAPAREPIQMPTIYSEDLTSDLSVYDLPLDADVDFDNVEYAHAMRRIGIVEGELGTPVSAFNSSI
jgi:hypothetical protein